MTDEEIIQRIAYFIWLNCKSGSAQQNYRQAEHNWNQQLLGDHIDDPTRYRYDGNGELI